MRLLPNAISLGALGAGLVLTALVTLLLAWATGERARLQFEAAARDAEAEIVERVETSIALLRATAGLFASHEAVRVESFRRYVARLALRERYPGILGIGYTQKVAPQMRAAFEQDIRGQGHPAFRIWPAQERDVLHAIVFLEPLDARNRAAIGYDMYTNPVRRAAMQRARDQGEAAASGVVELVQEIDAVKQPGFLIYVPVYEGGEVPPTLEERRARLAGFAYSPIRAIDFLSSAFPAPPRVPLAVFHGRGESGTRLYSHQWDELKGTPRFRAASTVEVAGEPWTFVFRSTATRWEGVVLPLAAVLCGGLLSLLLAVLIGREHAARAQAQKALERERGARAEAERANAMKDEFLATLSHELRTPLNAIVGWAELLRRGVLSGTEQRKAIDIVDRNARAQARLIDDLLDMNRIVSGKMRLELERVDAAAVAASAVASVTPNATAKGVRVELASASAPLMVMADPARLQQIVWNLVSNAVKFTPAGGQVEVRVEPAGRRARLTVSDTGEGIDPQLLERIFDRFAQADARATRAQGGLGLGLAIVRHLVEMHGGTARAESAGRGQGARFIVELPREAEPAPAAGVEASERPARDTPDLSGLRVLVVEDEPDARALVHRLLEGAGAEVHCVSGAQEALRRLPEVAPDVLLSDIGMPGMDGYELLRRVRRLPASGGGNVLAVAVSAYVRAEDRLEAQRAGFQAHLGKPVRAEELLETIGALAKPRRGR